MTRLKHLILLMAAVPLMATAQVNVEARIDSTVMMIGEQAHIALTVTMRDGQQAVLPTPPRGAFLTPGVEVVEVEDIDTTRLENNSVRVGRTFTITSFEDTLYYIPPFSVTVDGKVYKSKNLALKVLTMPVDTLHPEQFFPPKGVQDNPFEWDEWAPLFWMSLLLLALALTMLYLIKRLRDNKPIIAKIRFVRKLLPHQVAMREIHRIKDSRLSDGQDQKAYYTALTDTLRKYLRDRFGFNAMEMTSDEIISHLKKEEDPTKIEELRRLLETADLVKFAKFSAMADEKDRGMESVVEFINDTKTENIPVVEKVEPKLSEADKRSVKSRKILLAVIAAMAIAIAAVCATVCWQAYLLIL